jgi:cytoskeletal protein RodZ
MVKDIPDMDQLSEMVVESQIVDDRRKSGPVEVPATPMGHRGRKPDQAGSSKKRVILIVAGVGAVALLALAGWRIMHPAQDTAAPTDPTEAEIARLAAQPPAKPVAKAPAPAPTAAPAAAQSQAPEPAQSPQVAQATQPSPTPAPAAAPSAAPVAAPATVPAAEPAQPPKQAATPAADEVAALRDELAKTQALLRNEQDLRKAAEWRAKKAAALRVTAVLADGVVITDIEGKDRVVAVGQKVMP